MKLILYTITLLSLIFPSALFAQETVSCLVEPYSQVLKEKGSVTFTYDLTGSGDASRLSLGGLPGGVTGAFTTGNKISFSALQGAQLGSFDVSVLYDIQEGDSLYQSACSLNIVVEAAEDRDISQDYIPQPSHLNTESAVIEKGDFTLEPAPEDETPQMDSPASVENPESEKFVSPLYVGLRNDEVRELQMVLQEEGYFPSWVNSSGYYGEITEKAVSDFQAKHGIDPVGFVGPLTRATLNSL